MHGNDFTNKIQNHGMVDKLPERGHYRHIFLLTTALLTTWKINYCLLPLEITANVSY